MMQQQFLNPDNYFEKPRPNFYNVIKKLREGQVLAFSYIQVSYKRILYIAKLNESEMKGEHEGKGESKLESKRGKVNL